MAKRKPETLALIVALVGTLTVLSGFLVDLVVARNRDIDAGEKRLQHFSVMMAEHTARTFEAIDILLREIATDLSGTRNDWEIWPPAQGWEYVAQRHSRAMPQLRDLIIFDRTGDQRFISTYFPPPHINVKDRPYFKALENGATSATFGPYIGRNSGRYTYGLAHRLNAADGSFAGVAFAGVEPAYLQDFCWPNRLSDDFEAVLINADGRTVASCRPTDTTRQSPILGVNADETLFGGRLRGQVPVSGLIHRNGLIVSVSPVPGFSDLRILSAIPESTVLASWRSRMFELTTLGLLVATVLIVGALLVRRQVREMADIAAQLAASHEHLEARIHEATVELAGQKDEAERANKAKSRFLAAASHDLRQPLHALSLFAADMQRQIRSNRTQDLPHLAEQIATSTVVLSELLDSLLDVSRLDVSGIQPDIRAFELAPMFERIAQSFHRAATDRNIRLRVRPTHYWVLSDQVMVERIVSNLVSNALRYTPRGGRVLLAARPRDEEILIEVRDSGVGIAPEHQAAIFTEFYQVGNAAREQHKGLGLGLSIVDRLTRALEAPIALRSRLGEGTTFSLRLPKSLPALPVSTLPAPLASPGRVHLIGDSDNLASCIALIETWGYTISIGDGAKPAPADAVLIIDQDNLPQIVTGLTPDRPVVVLVESADKNLPPGVHALPLPIRPAKLRALLGQLQKTLSKSIP